MYIIDTSIFCASFLKEDINNEKAIELLSEIDNKIYIPYVVFTETITVLTYKNSKELANEFVDFVLSDERFIFIYEDIISEISFWKTIDKRLSYIDIILVYLSIKYQAKLISFDEEMNKLYKKYFNYSPSAN